MSTWIRSGVLAGAAELVGELHGDFDAIALEAGLRREALADPNMPIEVATVPRFLDLASERLSCPSFSLRLGQRQNLLNLFGSLSLGIRSATTIDEFVRNLVDFFPLHTRGAILSLSRAEDGMLVNYELAADVHTSHRHVVELGFSVLLAEIRRHCVGWFPAFLAFRHAPPLDMRGHERLLGTNPLFNADRNSLLLDSAVLSNPFHHPNSETSGQRADINRPGPIPSEYLPIYAERLVRASLPSRLLTLDDVAGLLRLSRRSLQRKLAASATSFEAIVDAVRADLALAYLKDSGLTIAQIAETLHFSETSALSRSVRRWHGQTPRDLRGSARSPQRSDDGAQPGRL